MKKKVVSLKTYRNRAKKRRQSESRKKREAVRGQERGMNFIYALLERGGVPLWQAEGEGK